MSTDTEVAELTARAQKLRESILRAQLELKAASAQEREIAARLEKLADAPAEPPEPARSSREVTTGVIPRKAKQIRRVSFGLGVAAAFGTFAVAAGLALALAPSAPLAVARTPRIVSRFPVRAAPENTRLVSKPAPRVVVPQSPPPADPFKDSYDVAPAMGSLTVVCIPKCDHIVDNGEELGPGHIFSRKRPVGRHVLVMSSSAASDPSSQTVTVNIAPNQLREVRIALGRPASAHIPTRPDVLGIPDDRD